MVRFSIMKVYVLIWWFYEGDSNLVNSFEGVFSDYDKAMFRKNEIDTTNRELVSTEEAEKRQYEHGSYGGPSYFEIRECII